MDTMKLQRARRCVNVHTGVAVCVVFLTAWIPGAAAVLLLAQEAVMAYNIGGIFKADFSSHDSSALTAHIGLAALIGKVIALEATIIFGPFAFVIKPVIAALIVKALGEMIIKYCEQKWGVA